MELFTAVILTYLEVTLNIPLLIFQITVIIFLFAKMKKSKSIFRSAYFIILNCVYVLDVLFTIGWIYGHLVLYSRFYPFMPIVNFIQWYSQNILGFWEFLLGLNRCTALAFPNLHNKLWNGNRVIIHLLLLFSFPFISQGYIFYEFGCRFIYDYEEKCNFINIQANHNIAIINIVFGLLALVFILIGVLLSPKIQTPKTIKAKMERRLIFQSIFSSSMLVLLYGISYYSFYFNALDFLFLSYFLYLMQFYPSIIILFIISPIIREEYAKFYRLKGLIIVNVYRKNNTVVKNFGSMTTNLN